MNALWWQTGVIERRLDYLASLGADAGLFNALY